MSSTRSGPRSSWSSRTRRAGIVGVAGLALPLLLAGAARPAANDRPDIVDSGTFTLYLKGVRIGEERFVIRRERAGSAGPVYRAGAELNLKLDGSTMRVSVALKALGAQCRPLRYEAEINGSEPTTIVGTLTRDRVRLDVRSPAGDAMKEFLVPENVAVLDRYIAHHYFFAAKLMAGASAAEASVIVPRDRNQERVQLVDRGVEPVRVGPTELQLRHIEIVGQSGTTHHVWLDGERVMKVEIPEREFSAVRSDVRSDSSESIE